MNLTAAELTALLSLYLGPFLRISALLMVAPIFSSAGVPARVRLGLALALTLLIAPIVPAPTVNVLGTQWLLIAVQQLALGIAMGFILQLVFNALVIGGQVIAMSMGLGFAASVDPVNGVSIPVVSQFFSILATLIFLSLNGHLLLIQILAGSFQALPVGPIGVNVNTLWRLIAWSGQMFVGAIHLALPALAALLIINIALGITSRAAPSLNLFSIGFPITLIAGSLMLIWTLPALPTVLSSLLDQAWDAIGRLLEG